MINIKKIILLSATITSICSGHIIKIEQFTKDDQTIYCFGDWNQTNSNAENPKNFVYRKQQQAIIEAAKKTDATVIVEDVNAVCKQFYDDPFNFNPNMYSLPAEAFKNTPESAYTLVGLSSVCALNKIPRINVEFRFAIQRLTIGIALQTTKNVADAIAQFDDPNPIIKQFYEKQLETYNTNLKDFAAVFALFSAEPDYNKELSTLHNEDALFQYRLMKALLTDNIFLKLEQFMAQDASYKTLDIQAKKEAIRNDPVAFVHHILRIYDARLIDALIVACIAIILKDKPTIFICAGFNHINIIRPLLTELGYTRTILAGSDEQDDAPGEPDAIDIKQAFEPILQHTQG